MSLTQQELQGLQKATPANSSIIANAVAKLYLASPSKNAKSAVLRSFPGLSEKKWTFTGIQGALVLTVDRSANAILLQIFDLPGLANNTIIKRFEHEIYYDMEYKTLHPQFQCFEIEDCVAGLSFAAAPAAKLFYSKLRSFIPHYDAKALAKESSSTVSNVINVVHNHHLGVDDVDIKSLSPEWKTALKQAGVKKRDMKDPVTRRELVKSIQQNGYSLDSSPFTYQDRGETAVAATATTRVYTAKELEKHYTRDQLDMYTAYKQQLEEYEQIKREYDAYLLAMEKQQSWETDNAQFLAEEEKRKRESKELKYQKVPPPLPARRRKPSAVSTPPQLPPRKVTLTPKQVVAVEVMMMDPVYEMPTELPPPPPPPQPKAPNLPTLANGHNPVESLQAQLLAVKLTTRRRSEVFIDAKSAPPLLAGSGGGSYANLLASAPSKDILGLMQSVLASRRAQLTEDGKDDQDDDSSSDGWSD